MVGDAGVGKSGCCSSWKAGSSCDRSRCGCCKGGPCPAAKVSARPGPRRDLAQRFGVLDSDEPPSGSPPRLRSRFRRLARWPTRQMSSGRWLGFGIGASPGRRWAQRRLCVVRPRTPGALARRGGHPTSRPCSCSKISTGRMTSRSRLSASSSTASRTLTCWWSVSPAPTCSTAIGRCWRCRPPSRGSTSRRSGPTPRPASCRRCCGPAMTSRQISSTLSPGGPTATRSSPKSW